MRGVRVDGSAPGAGGVGQFTQKNRPSGSLPKCERDTEFVKSVSIGRDCKIARDVIIMDTDQHSLPQGELVVRPVDIGDRVWIGARAMVLKGVHVGHDSVIGAGAIVTRSVPPHSTVVGTAARVLRTYPDRESLNLVSTHVQSS